jgi:hypothetical protein
VFRCLLKKGMGGMDEAKNSYCWLLDETYGLLNLEFADSPLV